MSARCASGAQPDFADMLRVHLLLAPEKVLFGTDAASYPGVPARRLYGFR
jgi:hypothetical protein